MYSVVAVALSTIGGTVRVDLDCETVTLTLLLARVAGPFGDPHPA